MAQGEDLTTAGQQRGSGVERRRVFVLLKIWQSLAGTADMPPIGAANAKKIGDLWDLCFVLDCRKNTQNPSFTHFGRDLVPIVGVDLTGRKRSTVPINNVIDYATLYHERAVAEGVPVSEGGRVRDDQGRSVLFRSILLPLSDSGRKVDALLGILTFKVE